MNTFTRNGIILDLHVKLFLFKVEIPAVVFYVGEAESSFSVTFGQRHKYRHMVLTSEKYWNIFRPVTVKHKNVNPLGM